MKQELLKQKIIKKSVWLKLLRKFGKEYFDYAYEETDGSNIIGRKNLLQFPCYYGERVWVNLEDNSIIWFRIGSGNLKGDIKRFNELGFSVIPSHIFNHKCLIIEKWLRK